MNNNAFESFNLKIIISNNFLMGFTTILHLCSSNIGKVVSPKKEKRRTTTRPPCIARSNRVRIGNHLSNEQHGNDTNQNPKLLPSSSTKTPNEKLTSLMQNPLT